MPKIYFHLLLLCEFWFQGITSTFADGEIGETSDILLRQKRVISRIPDEDVAVTMQMIPYIVRIKENRRLNCVGSIVSNHVVITAAVCLTFQAQNYLVFSGSNHFDHGFVHNVTEIKKRLVRPSRPTEGIALLTVDTPFVRGAYTTRIRIHSGILLPGTRGTISGWGCYYRGDDKGTRIPKSLRSTEVSIMAHRDCLNIYREHGIVIFESDICTFDPQRHCGHSDGGAPLVVDGYLVGVHLWTGPLRVSYNPEYPDVFALVQHADFNQWIRSNIDNIEAEIRNRHN